MDGGGGGGGSNSSGSNAAALTPQQQQQQQQQHILLQKQQQHQQQLYLLQQLQQQQQQQHPSASQQQQQQHQYQQQFQQLQQQAISRFPSNIDAHLRSPGLRSLHLNNPNSQQRPTQQQSQQQSQPAPSIGAQQQQQQQQQQMRVVGAGMRGPPPPEVEMALQDAYRVCNPDVKRPFVNLEDAVVRLLPYHVVSDFEAEEDDRILDSDTTGQVPSRLQQWDHSILTKIAEFTTTFEKQVLAFNIMSRKRALGEFRSEERLMIEQALLQEEKQTLLEIRAEIESREKAGREAAEAKMRMAMAQAEHARAEAQAQAHAEMLARGPMRASALGSHGDEGSGQDMGHEQRGNEEEMMHGWGNAQRGEDDDPSEDFLNDDNEQDNEEAEMQEEWRESGELDLNTR